MALKERRTPRLNQQRSIKDRQEAAPSLVIDQAPTDPVRPEAKVTSGKLGKLIVLLQADGGATLAQMMEATGWQAHSVRGAIAGSIKKKLGHEVISQKAEGERTYRIVTA